MNLIKKLLLTTLNLKISPEDLYELIKWQEIYNFSEPFPHFIKT